MTTTQSLLQQAIAAAKAGNRGAARELLLQVVNDDERNEQAWLWLSGVVDDPAEQRIALENVLDINPRNASALKGMAWLDAHHPRPQPEPPATSAPESAPAPTAAPEPPARTLPPLVQTPLPENPNACPYCGTNTTPAQHTCPACKRSLMVEGDARPTRSVFLFLLALIWDFIALGNVIACVLLFFSLVLAYQANRDGVGATSAPMGNLLLAAVFWIVVVALVVTVTVGLYRRRRWAYIVNCVAVGLQLVSALVGVVVGARVIGAVQAALESQPEPPPVWVGTTLTTVAAAVPLCGLLFVALWIALSALSYRDFFGQRVRVQIDVPERKAEEHFNLGLAFKNRGMWYAAAREWEGAVKYRPNEADYHRALGLAYAQIKDYGRALRELHAAIDLRPGDALLKDDLATVEKMALQ
jgi:tetratricopeptide (TPR) repeat protein